MLKVGKSEQSFVEPKFGHFAGQSLSVIAHVAAVLLGLAKISPRSGALSRSCVAAVSESALPALVAAVLALWQKSAPGKKGSSGKSAAVPVQGAAVAAVWKQRWRKSVVFFLLSVLSLGDQFGGHAGEQIAGSRHNVLVWSAGSAVGQARGNKHDRLDFI